MKNKKIRNIILLFLLMIVVLVGGFFLIQSEIEGGKISVVVATQDIAKEYKVSKTDLEKGWFTVEKRDAEHVGEFYYTSVAEMINDCLANNYIVDNKILKGQVVSKQHFGKKIVTPSGGGTTKPVEEDYTKYFNDPVKFYFTNLNLTDVDSILKNNMEIKVYTLNNNLLSVLFEKLYVRKVEYTTNAVTGLQVVLEREDYLKALTVNSGQYQMFVFKKDVTEKKISEVMASINQNYGSPSKDFEPISDDLTKLLVNENGITFYNEEAKFIWKGTNLSSMYVEHYNLTDGERGIYYGRYPSEVFRYNSKTDEFSINTFDAEGYYEVEIAMKIKKVTFDENGNQVEKEETVTKKYSFVVEKPSNVTSVKDYPLKPADYRFNYFAGNYEILLKQNKVEYYYGTTPELYFTKGYFKNVEALQNVKISLEQIQFNYGEFTKTLTLAPGVILKYKDYFTRESVGNIVSETTYIKSMTLIKEMMGLYETNEFDEYVLDEQGNRKELEDSRVEYIEKLFKNDSSYITEDKADEFLKYIEQISNLIDGLDNDTYDKESIKEIFIKLYFKNLIPKYELKTEEKEMIADYFMNNKCSLRISENIILTIDLKLVNEW